MSKEEEQILQIIEDPIKQESDIDHNISADINISTSIIKKESEEKETIHQSSYD